MMMQTKVRSNTKFYFLILIFVLPVVASWLLYHFHDHFQFKTTNRGVLMKSPLQVQAWWKIPANHKWQIVYMPSVCAEGQCEKMMFTLSQLRKALGKDYERVNLTLVTQQPYEAKQKYDFQHIVFTKNQESEFQLAIQKNQDSHFDTRNKIYLVDPIGNLFMYYVITTNPMDIFKDVKHLLGVSQIG